MCIAQVSPIEVYSLETLESSQMTHKDSQLHYYRNVVKPIHHDKIVEAGQSCRKCGTPVIRHQHKPGFDSSRKKDHWFEWWLKCPNDKCRTVYFVDDAKRAPEPNRQPELL